MLSVLVLFAAGVPAGSGDTGTLPDQVVWSTQESVGEWVNPVDSVLSPGEETLYHLGASPGDDKALHLAAVRVSDGQLLWRVRWGSDTSPLAMALEVHPLSGVIYVAGATHGESGRPYYTAYRPMVWAFDPTGPLLWSTRILDRESEGDTSGRDLALDLGTGRLVVAVYGARFGNVVALDASTGEEVWRACPESRCAQTSELHIWPEQSSIFAVGGRHGYGSTRWAIFVHSIDLQTGEIRWTRSFDDSPGRHIGGDEGDDILYALSGLGRLYALQPDTGNLLWAASPPRDFGDLRQNRDLVVDEARNRVHVIGGEKHSEPKKYHGRIWTYAGVDGTLLWRLRHFEPVASSVSFRSAVLSEDEGRLYANVDTFTNGIVNGHATLVVDSDTGRLLGGGHHGMSAMYYGIEYSERANLILRTGVYGPAGFKTLIHAAYGPQLPSNSPPVPRIEGPRVANVNEAFTFTGGASSDPDGTLTQWTWDTPDDLVLDETQVDVTLEAAGDECLRLQLLDDLYADAVTEHCIAVSDQLNVTAELPRESYAALEHADLHVTVKGVRDQAAEAADVTVRIELHSRSGGTPGLAVYNLGRHSGCINWEHTGRTGEDGTLVVRIPPVGKRCAFAPLGVGSATMIESDLYYTVEVEARWLGANAGTAVTEYDVHV